uniref:LysR substrate-binding domain-containing protein n=1 Tax=Stappia sp. TaxID=1870903 RepID=UPI003BAC0C4E
MQPVGGSPLDTLLLRTFVEVVACGSFATAADRLALTPSAVSGHIRRLEQSAAVTLLTRTTRRVDLTPSGATLYAYARNILDLEREARARLRGSPWQGHLRIGASEDFAGAWLPEALRQFRLEYPVATFELKVGITLDLLRQQDQGGLDLVFGKQCVRSGAGGHLLWEEPLTWVCAESHDLDAEEPLPLALFAEPCVYREAATTALNRAGRPWRVIFESSSIAGCLSAARAGIAVTVVSRSQKRDGLRELAEDDGVPELPHARFYAFPAVATRATTDMIEAARRVAVPSRFQSGARAVLADK